MPPLPAIAFVIYASVYLFSFELLLLGVVYLDIEGSRWLSIHDSSGYLVLPVVVPLMLLARWVSNKLAHQLFEMSVDTRNVGLEHAAALRDMFVDSFWYFVFHYMSAIFIIAHISKYENTTLRPFETFPNSNNKVLFWYFTSHFALWLVMLMLCYRYRKYRYFTHFILHHSPTVLVAVVGYNFSVINAACMVLVLYDVAEMIQKLYNLSVLITGEQWGPVSAASFIYNASRIGLSAVLILKPCYSFQTHQTMSDAGYAVTFYIFNALLGIQVVQWTIPDLVATYVGLTQQETIQDEL